MNNSLKHQTAPNILTLVGLANIKKHTDREQLEMFERLPAAEKMKIILDTVCEIFKVTAKDMRSVSSSEHLSYIRFIFYYVAAFRSDCSQTKIADCTGRERTAAVHGRDRVSAWIKRPESNPIFNGYWRDFTNNAPKYLLT